MNHIITVKDCNKTKEEGRKKRAQVSERKGGGKVIKYILNSNILWNYDYI